MTSWGASYGVYMLQCATEDVYILMFDLACSDFRFVVLLQRPGLPQ